MIEVSHLTKKYGQHTAVEDLSFTIEEGQIYGFLGPNGAGKSTTMNIMTGCLAATSGDVKIGGFDIFEDAKQAKKLIGYLPEIPPLYVEQTALEYLQFVAEAKGIRRAEVKAEVERVVEETHIEEVAHKLIKHLSKGYRQRVGIAQALLGNPEVIILDEPTVGLDPAQIIEIRELIKELGSKHTVILSSHILPEVQAICDKVLIIAHGRLVAFDTPENIAKALAGGDRIELCVETEEDQAKDILSGLGVFSQIQTAKSAEGTCDLILQTEGEDTRAVCRKLFFAFADEGIAILQMNSVHTSLEDIFLELTQAPEQDAMREDALEANTGSAAWDSKAEQKKEQADEEAEYQEDEYEEEEDA